MALLNRLNSDSSLAPLVAQFVPLKISTEREEWQQWARRYQAEGAAIPKIYIVGADGQQLYGSSGSKGAQELNQILLQALSQAGRVFSNQELALLTENVSAAKAAKEDGDIFTAVVKLKSLRKLGDFGDLRSHAKPAVEADALVKQLTDDGKSQLESAVAKLTEKPDDFSAAVAYTEARRQYSQLPTLTQEFADAARAAEKEPESAAVLAQAEAISKARGYAKTARGGEARAIEALNRLIAQHPNTPAAEMAQEDLRQLTVKDAEEKDSEGASRAPSRPPLRTWTDNTGQFRIQARLVKVTGETVTLERASGENINVPIDRLSDDDREYLRRTSSATK